MSGATPAASTPRHRAVNLAHLLTQTARRLPHRDAIVHGDVRWTWRELDRRVSALAAELLRRGLAPGDCVLLDGPNHPEFIQAMFAVWRAGGVLAPVNSRLHDADIKKIASVCRPVAMVAHASTTSHVAAVLSERDLPAGVLGLALEGTGAISGVADSEEAVADASVWAGDPAWYFFTSGTSGTPKAAVLTHDQLGYVVTNHLADLMPTTDETHSSLVVAPLSHGAGVHLLPQVARGATTVIPASPSLVPAEAWALVERERVSNIFTVPTIVKLLVEDPSVDEHDHSTLQYVVYAGAPMPSVDQQRARATLGDVLVQYYGLAEVTGNITVLPSRNHGRPSPAGVDFGTCGYPRTGMQVSIQDDDGAELAAGEAGEICVAGPGVFREYLDNPAANASAFRDGWFRTGDIGFVDDEGFLFITGRLSDMYISGGSNVHPRDIEEKMLAHPAVREAVVLGMPDPTWGEVGVAVCVLDPATTVDAEELRAWLAPRMARYKVPRDVVFWDELPRSGYGKVVRRTIRDELVARGWRPAAEKAPV
ncbi:AMP-binding protein [Nocardioides acrostichi]|uniref:AMP-binding protein n=1 Tax=Nocardioides acrostichi TaxID=2784339 RepID=A0A930Y9U8_9ACTN|nr:AMP-binding protein [Nocardioides acrostichi]MBF4160748.1 AMP-binding protein [Nocardioides acrostichi]